MDENIWMEGTLGSKNKQKLCVLCLVSGQKPQLWTYNFPEDSMALPMLLCRVSSRVHLCLKSKRFLSYLWCQWGSETCFQPQFSQLLRFFFYFIYILYRGKKEHSTHTHILLILNCSCGQCF